MKKKVFNLHSVQNAQRKGYGAVMNMSAIVGTLSLSKVIGEKLALHRNKICIVQDLDKPKNWYFQIDNTDNGIKLRPARNGRFFFQSAAVIRQIYDSVGLDKEKRYNIMMSTEPTEDGMYAILTHSASERPDANRKKKKQLEEA